MTAPAGGPGYLAELVAAEVAAQAVSSAVSEQMAMAPTIARVATTAGQMRGEIAERVLAVLRPRWLQVDPWRGAEVQAFVDDAWPVLVAAQRQVVAVTAAEQVQHLAELGESVDVTPHVPDEVRGLHTSKSTVVVVDRRPERQGRSIDGHAASKNQVTVKGPAPRRRVSVERGAEVLNRPARAMRAELASGSTVEEALAVAEVKLATVVDQNLALAQREAEHQVLTEAASRRRSRIVGWRRIVHPELSRGGSCGLCIAASTRVYSVSTLKPLHDHCNCVPIAVTADHDPGAIINTADLENLYTDAGGTGRELKRTRYRVDEHGELGPVLLPKKRGTVPRATTTPPDPSSPKVRTAVEKMTPAELTERIDMYENKLARLRRIHGVSPPGSLAEAADRYQASISNLQNRLSEIDH